jgi:trans-aconitate 2-methyltransferase
VTARDWDARTYDRIANPMARWGGTVVERLVLRGDERVLDAGCGSGRVTERLLERLPRGHVVALDGSPQMIVEARQRLAPSADRVEFVVADLTQALSIAPVDAILSTATFHWIADHDALLRHLAAVLRPGGQLVAQCGGAGCLMSIVRIIDDLDPDGRLWRPWHFATAEATARRLEAAGFVDARVWLHDEPTRIPVDTMPDYLRTIILGSTLERMPEADREPLVQAVAARIPDGHLDYVRLNIVARLAAAQG